MKRWIQIAACLLEIDLGITSVAFALDVRAPIRLSFSDVPINAWYTQAVSYVYGKDWMHGYNDERFGPQEPVLRSELAAVLERYDRRKERLEQALVIYVCRHPALRIDANASDDYAMAELQSAQKYLCNTTDGD